MDNRKSLHTRDQARQHHVGSRPTHWASHCDLLCQQPRGHSTVHTPHPHCSRASSTAAASMHTSHGRRCTALSAAISKSLFSDDSPSAMFLDLDQLSATIQHVQHEAGYPVNTLHTVAVKANPVGKVLQVFRDHGMGAEAASLGELQQALRVGFPPTRVVFDSPAKTLSELRFALQAGVAVNLDNFQELQRTAALLEAQPELLRQPGQHTRLIGLRINPQVGEGSIAALSTGGAVSKFGFPLQEARAELLQAFRQHPWLNMLHLHVGSQGLSMGVIIAGVKAVWELSQEIEGLCGPGRLRMLDIGGGLSVDYGSDEAPKETLFQQQATQLAAAIPQLFEPGCQMRLATENGRSLLAKAGFTASRVEYTKSSGGRHIAVTQVGADLFMRACYLPDTWGLRVFVCSSSGQPQEGLGGVEVVAQDIAGPLCFQGDRLAVNKLMPKAEVGDFVVVADTGAYTLSMYSRYNSRCSPPVYGFTTGSGSSSGSRMRAGSEAAAGGCEAAAQPSCSLVLLRAQETLEQVLQFWQ